MDYIEAFKNLRTNNKYSRKSPHKAVLLLTIIKLYEDNLLSKNEIKYDEILKDTFIKVWNRVLPNESTFYPEAYLPFWYLQNEEFWHIVPIRGREDIIGLMRDSGIKPSETKLYDCVNYVELDEDLFFLISLSTGRSSLKRALLETYSTLSEDEIDNLSQCKDNTVDNSSSAIETYKKILSIPASKGLSVPKSVNPEMEKKFLELDDDIQLIIRISYYSFLKEHKQEREMIREICPTVYDLYDHIAVHPLLRVDIVPSLAVLYENFLCDLKISLMSENDSTEVINKITDAVNKLRNENSSIEPVESMESSLNTEQEECIDSKSSQADEIKHSTRHRIVPATEDREGEPWTESDDELLRLYHKLEYSLDEIAVSIGRTSLSVKRHLIELGLQKSTSVRYDNDSSIEQKEASKNLNIFVENIPNHGFIFDQKNDIVFSVDGQLKIFHGKIYRFNYQQVCFTVKDIICGYSHNWQKGSKKLVSYSNAPLFSCLNRDSYAEQIEDFVEDEDWTKNKILVNGQWFDYQGYIIGKQSVTTKMSDFNYEDQNSHESESANIFDVSFIKEVDKSLLSAGLTLPLSVISSLPNLKKAEKRSIMILIDGEQFEAKFVNVDFSEKYADHNAIFQIRYSAGSPIAEKLRSIFSYSLHQIVLANNRGERLPKGYTGEYIEVQYSKDSDLWAFKCFPKD